MQNKIKLFEKEIKNFKGKEVQVSFDSGISFYIIYEKFDIYNYENVEFVFKGKESHLSEGALTINDIKEIYIEYTVEDEPCQVEVTTNNDIKILFQLCNCD